VVSDLLIRPLLPRWGGSGRVPSKISMIQLEVAT